MKFTKWFYLGLPVLIGVGMLLASQPSKQKQQPPPRQIRFKSGGFVGRPLTGAEWGTVAAAIESIRTPPPDSIRWTDDAGFTNTVSCSAFAEMLKKQLNSGRMQAEVGTTRQSGANHLSDGQATDKDQMNVDSELIRWAFNHPDSLIYLEETLVHEGTHKSQSTSVMTSDEEEIDALSAELAYKDSIGLDTSDAYYRFKDSLLTGHLLNHLLTELVKRELIRHLANGYNVFIQHNPFGNGHDFLTSFKPGDLDWYEFDLSPFLRASDMMVFERHFMIFPDQNLAMICGGDPLTGVAKIWGFTLLNGEVFGPAFNYNFGPPQGLNPMFFYSMTRNTETALYYMADTLGKTIVLLGDAVFDDLIPDEYLGIYASASWPGFEALETMRGVEAIMHSTQGFGIIVYEGQMRDLDCMNPYDECHFLPDADGDSVADACNLAHRYEFLDFPPDIQHPLPWAGEDFVQIFGPWNHTINVYSTDSLGNYTLDELLGSTIITGGVDAQCNLNRALEVGEFVLAEDASSGARLLLATKVINPTPEEVTVYYDVGAFYPIVLRWEEVPEASHYNIYESDDPMDFSTEPTYLTNTNSIALAMSPNQKLFYLVKAER